MYYPIIVQNVFHITWGLGQAVHQAIQYSRGSGGGIITNTIFSEKRAQFEVLRICFNEREEK